MCKTKIFSVLKRKLVFQSEFHNFFPLKNFNLEIPNQHKYLC